MRLLLLLACVTSAQAAESLWMEAEDFAPLEGANFSFQHVEDTTKGSWALAGPGVAAEWTQGGESGFMSIAARGDEPAEISVGRELEVPAAGRYTLWVRYADYRGKKESFGVRIRQGKSVIAHRFGDTPVVDELDPMKLLWSWSFGWDHADVDLAKGRARVEIFTTGKTEARRHVDCLCLTNDGSYRPWGREKPDHPTWRLLRQSAPVAPLATPSDNLSHPIAEGKPTFLWNLGDAWLAELDKKGIEWPFAIDPPLLQDFLAAYRDKELPIFSHPSSAPTVHLPLLPKLLAPGARFVEWLARHPERKLGVLLNYGEWPPNAEHAVVWDNLSHLGDRFVGFISGENLDYAPVDNAALQARVKAARSRAEVLTAIRELHSAALTRRLSGWAGRDLASDEAWAHIVPCLSVGTESLAHAAASWGVKRLGHEGTAAHPVLARRLAFLRGAARQFAAHVLDYQSANFGDAATMFDRAAFFYPASSRYVLDNQYDVWAGAGLDWLLKDYLLFYLAGADSFYHEEGNDLFWKPGGNSAGDGFPVELSPRGRLTVAMQTLFAAHPRPTQLTPVAFLLDEAHGWNDIATQPGAFNLDPAWNPLLARGRHEASIRGWFDVAWFPAPDMLNLPATAIRQTYVNGLFGDLFDVLTTAPGRTSILGDYSVVIAAGEVRISDEWGRALLKYVRDGGTLVVSADQLSGPGAAPLLPSFGPESESASFNWMGTELAANRFRHRAVIAQGGRVLATAGTPVVVARSEGKGQIIVLGVPLGLGIDQQPVPLVALLVRHLVKGLLPVEVHGDVEYLVDKLDDGGLLVALLNNRGVDKPQHGVVPTDHSQTQAVELTVPFAVARSSEWLTSTALSWQGSSLTLTVPAGVARLVAIYPR
jgi:hypothetical protein